jgi:hypothetical protein
MDWLCRLGQTAYALPEDGDRIKCPEIGTSSIDLAKLSRFYLKTEAEWTSTVDWAKLRRFYLKTETESISRNVVS